MYISKDARDLKFQQNFYKTLKETSGLWWLLKAFAAKGYGLDSRHPDEEYALVCSRVEKFFHIRFLVAVFAGYGYVTAVSSTFFWKVLPWIQVLQEENTAGSSIIALVYVLLALVPLALVPGIWRLANECIDAWVQVHWTTAQFRFDVQTIQEMVGSLNEIFVLIGNGEETNARVVPVHVKAKCFNALTDQVMEIKSNEAAGQDTVYSKRILKEKIAILVIFQIVPPNTDFNSIYQKLIASQGRKQKQAATAAVGPSTQ